MAFFGFSVVVEGRWRGDLAMSGTLSCTTVITRAVSRLTAMAYLGRGGGGGEEGRR